MRWWPFGKRKDAPDPAATVSNATSWEVLMGTLAGGATTAAGIAVTPESAMKFSAVFACVRLLGGAIASAPVKVYRSTGPESREHAATHPLAAMLRIRPNRRMTAATFWKAFVQQKILTGNGYAHIIRKPGGQPVALMPLESRRVTVWWAWERGLTSPAMDRNALVYQVQFDDGAVRFYAEDDILHVPNVGWDGKQGMSTIKAAAQGIGLGMAAEESSARFFANGMQTNLALRYPAKMTQEAHDRLRQHFIDRNGGARNTGAPLILTEGGEITQLSLSAEDAQLIESRQFSVIDICRFFGVPPVMIGETEKTSSWGAGVEQMARWFTMFTLNDHLTAIEQELAVKLFGGDGHFAEFDETELTRGDTKTRGDFYRVARGSMQEPGFMTINEIRAAEGLPPIPGGDDIQRPEATPSGAGVQQ